PIPNRVLSIGQLEPLSRVLLQDSLIVLLAALNTGAHEDGGFATTPQQFSDDFCAEREDEHRIDHDVYWADRLIEAVHLQHSSSFDRQPVVDDNITELR